MMTKKLLVVLMVVLASYAVAQTKLSVQWEELTGPEFVQAIERSGGTCMLPVGILEKHGPHLPIGTDLINVRKVSLDAAQQEYAIVFPPYYFAQIFEARHEPGTMAYSLDLQLKLLQETVDEMGRNGCKKILIVNGHGGNESLLPLFAQSQLSTQRDYVVYVFGLPNLDQPGRPAKRDADDMHGGSTETSHMMVTRPDLVHMDRAGAESGKDQNHLQGLPGSVYTAIWWYAKFPDHFAGDPASATLELGKFDMNVWKDQIVSAVRAIKADQKSQELQNEFFEKAKQPLKTKQ
jgi:creatinine amidohydrolase